MIVYFIFFYLCVNSRRSNYRAFKERILRETRNDKVPVVGTINVVLIEVEMKFSHYTLLLGFLGYAPWNLFEDCKHS